jgi:hypothetical protein
MGPVLYPNVERRTVGADSRLMMVAEQSRLGARTAENAGKARKGKPAY